MSESEKEYISLDDGLRALSTNQLEECIAEAISKATGCSGEVSCSISNIEHGGVFDSKLTLTLKSELDGLQF